MDQNGFISEDCVRAEIFGVVDNNTFEAKIKYIFINAKDSTIGLIDNLIVTMVGPLTVCMNPYPVSASNLLNIVGIIIMISFMIVFLINVVYSLLNSPSKISLLEEFTQGVITILVVVLIIAIINFYSTNDIFINAKKYIVNALVNFSFFTMMIKTIETMLVALANITLPLGPEDARGIFSISFSQLISVVFKSLDVVKGFFGLASVEYIFKLFLLCIGPKIIIELLLPIAALLRAFYFTRSGGNMIMGFSIAFIVIYPLIIYIYYNIYNNISSIWDVYFAEAAFKIVRAIMVGLTSILFPLAIKAFVSNTFNTIANIGNIGNIWRTIRNNQQQIEFAGLSIGGVLTLLDFIPAFYFVVFGYLQLGILLGLIFGPLALYFTVALTAQISKALGTEINIAALSRLI